MLFTVAQPVPALCVFLSLSEYLRAILWGNAVTLKENSVLYNT